MPVVDESRVETEWLALTDTERAFERLSSSPLYQKWTMISHFRRHLRNMNPGMDVNPSWPNMEDKF
jgi:hypothetical protein